MLGCLPAAFSDFSLLGVYSIHKDIEVNSLALNVFCTCRVVIERKVPRTFSSLAKHYGVTCQAFRRACGIALNFLARSM